MVGKWSTTELQTQQLQFFKFNHFFPYFSCINDTDLPKPVMVNLSELPILTNTPLWQVCHTVTTAALKDVANWRTVKIQLKEPNKLRTQTGERGDPRLLIVPLGLLPSSSPAQSWADIRWQAVETAEAPLYQASLNSEPENLKGVEILNAIAKL